MSITRFLSKHREGGGGGERAFQVTADMAIERRPSVVLRADLTVASCTVAWLELAAWGRESREDSGEDLLKQTGLRNAVLDVLLSGGPRTGVAVEAGGRRWSARVTGSGGGKPKEVLVTLEERGESAVELEVVEPRRKEKEWQD